LAARPYVIRRGPAIVIRRRWHRPARTPRLPAGAQVARPRL